MLEMAAFLFYRLFLAPLSYGLIHVVQWALPTKIRVMISERKDLRYPPLTSRPIVIHASSGEIEYAKPLIRELKELYPQIPILVSYFSPSAKKLILNFPGVDAIVPLPWDTIRAVNRFLNFYQPRLVLFARTDVWPELSYQIRKRKIPSCLFSATFADDSSRANILGRWINRWALSQLTSIFCVSDEDLSNLSKLAVASQLMVLGDTRFDQVQFRLMSAKKLNAQLRPTHPQVFIAGSTWPEDDDVLLSSLKTSYEKGWSWIWAPHEIIDSHLQDLERKISSQGLSVQRYSSAQSWSKNDVLIIDQVGLLAELYTWGSLAFVGGSFKQKVHSVMEPLAAGLPVLVGPHHLNNREAIMFQKISLNSQTAAVNCIHNAQELNDFFMRSFTSNSKLKELISKQMGASKKVAQWVAAQLREVPS